MRRAAAVDRLGQRGEVPARATDDRRAWLRALSIDEMRELTRRHGADRDALSTCWGWGAHASGTEDGTPVACSRCHRERTPLWFISDGVEIPRCWQCAALDHFTECDRWLDE